MTLRAMILFAAFIALGVFTFREERLRNRARLARLIRRQRRLRQEVQKLHRERVDLRREADALRSDRYYVERVARHQLAWRPSAQERHPSAPQLPPLGRQPGELVEGLPSLPPSLPGPVGPAPRPATVRAPQPPRQPQADRDRRLLACLGYRSVDHFQCKMMRGRPSGVLDDATRVRVRDLANALRQLGFESVKEFQARHRLTPDGIYGRRTERRVRQLLRRRSRAAGRSSRVIVHRGPIDHRRSGG